MWLLSHENKKSGYIQGAGGVEIKGLDGEVLDVQIYTYWFLEVMEKMAIFYNEKNWQTPSIEKQYCLKTKLKKIGGCHPNSDSLILFQIKKKPSN